MRILFAILIMGSTLASAREVGDWQRMWTIKNAKSGQMLRLYFDRDFGNRLETSEQNYRKFEGPDYDNKLLEIVDNGYPREVWSAKLFRPLSLSRMNMRANWKAFLVDDYRRNPPMIADAVDRMDKPAILDGVSDGVFKGVAHFVALPFDLAFLPLNLLNYGLLNAGASAKLISGYATIDRIFLAFSRAGAEKMLSQEDFQWLLTNFKALARNAD